MKGLEMENQEKKVVEISRRDFLKTSALGTAALLTGAASFAGGAWAAGSDEIRIGLVGCGGRGSGALMDAVNAAPGMKIVALGDLFQDRLDGLYNGLTNNKGLKDKVALTKDKCFTGFDAYKRVIETDANYIILATPPGFRATHLRYAVEHGKNVFAEKPVAVDAFGVRSVLESAGIAHWKKVGIVAGTQRRHEAKYVEAMKRIHDGAIGEIINGQCYWNQGGLWMHQRQPQWSDMEWQIRNWLYFTWLSGDHICEQHVHNIDVINWAMNAHPVSAYGMGGRQVRTDPAYGHIFDHFTIQFDYPNGARVISMCRQQDGTAGNVSEAVQGSKGTSNCCDWIKGANEWKFSGPNPGPYQQEHTDLINSIRAGKPLNEGIRIADSCLTAIMGRMSAYTGQAITWEQALNSKEDTMPKELVLGPLPVPPVAVPGKTPFI